VNIIFVLGSERLHSDLTRKYAHRTDEPIHVIKLDKSEGCIDRDEAFMKAHRQCQIRSYFFGAGDETALAPTSLSADFDDLTIYRIVDCKFFYGFHDTATPVSLLRASQADNLLSIPASEKEANPSFRPGNDDDDDIYGAQKGIYEKVTPSSQLMNSLLAVTTASANDKPEVIRDSSIKGYIYVADVDEGKRKVKLLSPQPGQIPANALVLGRFPEDVVGLLH
jgi:polyribonucleotide 5'-hydroxyl-kinase